MVIRLIRGIRVPLSNTPKAVPKIRVSVAIPLYAAGATKERKVSRTKGHPCSFSQKRRRRDSPTSLAVPKVLSAKAQADPQPIPLFGNLRSSKILYYMQWHWEGWRLEEAMQLKMQARQ